VRGHNIKSLSVVRRAEAEGPEQRRAEEDEGLGAEEHFSLVGRRVSRLCGETRVCEPHPGESAAPRTVNGDRCTTVEHVE